MRKQTGKMSWIQKNRPDFDSIYDANQLYNTTSNYIAILENKVDELTSINKILQTLLLSSADLLKDFTELQCSTIDATIAAINRHVGREQ